MTSTPQDSIKPHLTEYNSINSGQAPSNEEEAMSPTAVDSLKDSKDVSTQQGGLFRTPEEKRRFIMRQLLSLGVLLVIDVGLPLAIYYVLKMYVSQLIALILSGIPPFINVIVKFIRNRKIDALGCIFVFSYVLSGILSVISGDVRLALLRDSTVTCVISCAFFITLIPIKTRWFTLRPLTYIIAQSFVSELPPMRWIDKNGENQEQPLLEFLWLHVPFFRWHNYVMTSLWSFFLMAEFISKLLMIKSDMSVDDIVWISNVIVIAVVVFLSVLSTVGSSMTRRRSQKCVDEWRKENDFTAMYNSSSNQEPERGHQTKPGVTNESASHLV